MPTTLNLPPFREDQPEMWFTLADEGQFVMKGMQDRRHWFYTFLAMHALSGQQQDRVADLAGLSPVPVPGGCLPASKGEDAANA